MVVKLLKTPFCANYRNHLSKMATSQPSGITDYKLLFVRSHAKETVWISSPHDVLTANIDTWAEGRKRV
jgi:hypothetical protein